MGLQGQDGFNTIDTGFNNIDLGNFALVTGAQTTKTVRLTPLSATWPNGNVAGTATVLRRCVAGITSSLLAGAIRWGYSGP